MNLQMMRELEFLSQNEGRPVLRRSFYVEETLLKDGLVDDIKIEGIDGIYTLTDRARMVLREVSDDCEGC